MMDGELSIMPGARISPMLSWLPKTVHNVFCRRVSLGHMSGVLTARPAITIIKVLR
jgi:hypothetical protein